MAFRGKGNYELESLESTNYLHVPYMQGCRSKKSARLKAKALVIPVNTIS